MIDLSKETESLKATPLYSLDIQLGEPIFTSSGGVPGRGSRVMFPCRGGTATGRIRGEVVGGQSTNWTVVMGVIDGQQVLEIDGRLTIRTHDGVSMLVRPTGFAYAPDSPTVWNPDQGWDIRVSQMFETLDPRYAFLRSAVAVGMGRQQGPRITMDLYTLLRESGQD